jgi:hypothetical protein
MTTNERQQRMAERILEDENLRGELEDDAATALIDWASAQAAAAAANPARSDAVVEAQVQAIRQAARAAALSGETEPKRLIALAAAGLAPSQDAANVELPAAPTSASEIAEPAVATNVSVAENAAPPVVPAGNEASLPVAAAIPAALPTPSASPVEQSSEAAPQPAKPGRNRPRRKRSRLARFYKHLRGGR